jgi:hypothetical protein
MDIPIGAQAIGTSGDLGRVHGFVVAPRGDQVDHLIIRYGLLDRARMIPLACVDEAGLGMVHINLDAEKFEAMPDYAEAAYRAPITDYVAPPSLQDRGSTGAGFQVDVMLAGGAKGFAMDKPGGYPGGEQTVPTDMQIAVVTQGSPVLDVDGKALGRSAKWTWMTSRAA